ncbi:MAG: adenosylcobinamide amidohydrolase [Pseudonocardia sp.]|nr:adenosylcobinamide amidohydrolase [Pseudonocardia sp.]
MRWEGDRAWRCLSSGVLGGGIGTSRWVLNATVPNDFDNDLPADYLARLATTLGLAPEAGIGLLTAVDVHAAVTVARPGVTMCVTTGVGSHATWPAVRDAHVSEHSRAGTVNAVAWLDRPATPDALVNGVITVTEAKTQAFFEAGIAGTGTCTDTVTLLCPISTGDEEPTRYLGTRSPVGQALATAAHAAVATGLRQERAALATST